MGRVTATASAAKSTNLLDQIGHTPLIRLDKIDSPLPGIEIYGKAEFLNPGGSVKDRPALNMIRDGERTGRLHPGRTILDSTSGNTGIAYAMIASYLGYPVKLCLPANASPERKQILKAYGAEVILTDPGEGSDGAIRVCRKIYQENSELYFYPDQYSNPANVRAHYEGTAVEILQQTSGRLTHFIAGLGTTGTFVGTSRRLKEHDASIRTIAVQPEDSFHGLEGMKHLSTAIVPKIWDPGVADEVWGCPTEPAYDLVRAVARTEGLLVGHSSGAVLWAVRRLGETISRGVVVTVFPDSGDRYLSTGLYDASTR